MSGGTRERERERVRDRERRDRPRSKRFSRQTISSFKTRVICSANLWRREEKRQYEGEARQSNIGCAQSGSSLMWCLAVNRNLSKLKTDGLACLR
jgi:hypothetical protein